MKKLLLVLVSLTISMSAFAATRYIHSAKAVNLRAGPSEYADSSGTLVPNTQVNVIGTDRSTGYALIVTQDKLRGWIAESELTTATPKTPVLVQPNADNYKTTKTQIAAAIVATSPAKVAAVMPEGKLKPANNNPNKSYYDDVKEKLHAVASANAAAPNTLVKLSPQEMNNYTAMQRENRAWFITGAGILILGMLLGLFISRISWKRRSTWS